MNDKNLDTVLDALDIESLDPKEQEALLLDLNAIVYRGSMIRLMERMDDATRNKFDQLLQEAKTEEEIEEFLEIYVPNSGGIVEETIQELTDDILVGIGTN
ncbi:MAG TPA: DUF5663 domain-containing protein [Candidatus Paceibacterota bacterium]|nr:DUF5663 domain-containing protein [Candidatus Paceibacterota bacterium]